MVMIIKGKPVKFRYSSIKISVSFAMGTNGSISNVRFQAMESMIQALAGSSDFL